MAGSIIFENQVLNCFPLRISYSTVAFRLQTGSDRDSSPWLEARRATKGYYLPYPWQWTVRFISPFVRAGRSSNIDSESTPPTVGTVCASITSSTTGFLIANPSSCAIPAPLRSPTRVQSVIPLSRRREFRAKDCPPANGRCTRAERACQACRAKRARLTSRKVNRRSVVENKSPASSR